MVHRRDEPVRIERKRYAFLPEVFVWRGRRYDVRCVDRSWTRTWGTGPGRRERRYFRLCCDGGTFEIYHDVLANLWHLSAAAACDGIQASVMERVLGGIRNVTRSRPWLPQGQGARLGTRGGY